MGQAGSDMSNGGSTEAGGTVRHRSGTERYDLRELPPDESSGNSLESSRRRRARTVLQLLTSGIDANSGSEDEDWREWMGNLLRTAGDSDSISSESGDGIESSVSGFARFSCDQISRMQAKNAAKPSPELIKTLLESDFSFLTKEYLGLNPVSTSRLSSTTDELQCQKQNDFQTPLVKLLADREIGGFKLSKYPYFTQGSKCLLMGRYLPNYRESVIRYSHKLFCGTYSLCGDIFMSACQDQKIRLFDTSNVQFKRFRTIRAQNVGWSILDTAVSPDKRHLVYSSWCDDLYQVSLCGSDGLLDDGGGEGSAHVALPLCYGGNRFCVFSLVYSHNGDEILCGGNDGYIYLYDRGANVRSLRIDGHEDDVNAVSFVDSPTHILASGGDDGLCKVWDRRSLREDRPLPVGVFAGHSDGIVYVDARGDGRHLITNSKDQTIKLWDLRCFSNSTAISRTRKVVRNQRWDYRWQQRLAENQPEKRIDGDSSVMTYRGHAVLRTLIRAKFSPAHTTAQRYIFAGSANGEVYIYDALTGKVVQVLNGHTACVRDVSWHPSRPELVSSSWDFSLARWTYKENLEHVASEDQPTKEVALGPITRSKAARTS